MGQDSEESFDLESIEHVLKLPFHANLDSLRKQVINSPSFSYSLDLETAAEEDIILVGSLDEQEIQQEDQRLEEERILQVDSAAEELMYGQVDLLKAHLESTNKVADRYNRHVDKLHLHTEKLANNSHKRQVQMSKTFRKGEMNVRGKMRRLKGDLRVKLEPADDTDLIYGGDKRIYSVDWIGKPQPVEVRIEEIREIKDKLKKGEYKIKGFIKDRVGGNILSYPKAKGNWIGETSSLPHDGKYKSRPIVYRTSLFIPAPSKIGIRPTMTYCFQVIDKHDVVIGEGYFPILNNLFELCEGRYKVPIVRGCLSYHVEKFEEIEKLYRHNIDEWLCNLYIEIHKQNSIEESNLDYVFQLIPPKEIAVENKGFEVREYEELLTSDQYKQYRYSVVKSGPLVTPREKWSYLVSEIFSELGFSAVYHLEFWHQMFAIIIMIWASRFVHYTGEWIYLKSCEVPVTKFQSTILTIEVEYPNHFDITVEVGVVILGTVFCIAWFLFFCGIAYISLRHIGKFPNFIYRWIEAFGLVTILDPIITSIESLIFGLVYENWSGDCFKLYYYFQEREGNGIAGILMTIFIYAGLIGLSSFMFYNYFLYIHMNGRLMDMYMRLNAMENYFFIPHDSEISKRYLEHVCYKARNYRSINGESRAVVTTSYRLNEPYNPAMSQNALHIVIYTILSDRSRKLYRHFVRMPEGAVCELTGLVEGVKNAGFEEMLKEDGNAEFGRDNTLY